MEIGIRDPYSCDWRRPQGLPGGVIGCRVVSPIDGGAGRSRLNGDGGGHIAPQLLKPAILGENALSLAGQAKGLHAGSGPQQPGDFRERHVAGPASAITPNTEPRRSGNRDDEDQQQRYGDARLQQGLEARGAAQELRLTSHQFLVQVGRGGISRIPALFETAVQDCLESARHFVAHLAGSHRRLVQDRRHRRDGGVALERSLSGQQLIEHGTEAEDVRARVQRLAFHLLGRHVRDCPDRHALPGEACLVRWRADSRRFGGGRGGQVLRQAEVEDLDLSFRRHHDVRRLQVAVDDAALVRGAQRIDDLDGVLERLRDGIG